MTCYQLLCERANKNGDIVFFNRKTKIADFLRDIDLFANGLVAIGLEKGDVVTIYLPTCPQSLVAFYACSKLGMIANLVHPVTPLEQLEQNLKATNSKALLFYDALVKDERKLGKLGWLKGKGTKCDPSLGAVSCQPEGKGGEEQEDRYDIKRDRAAFDKGRRNAGKNQHNKKAEDDEKELLPEEITAITVSRGGVSIACRGHHHRPDRHENRDEKEQHSVKARRSLGGAGREEAFESFLHISHLCRRWQAPPRLVREKRRRERFAFLPIRIFRDDGGREPFERGACR